MPSLRSTPTMDIAGTDARGTPGPPPLVVRDTTWTPAVWGLLVVLCGALFLDSLDTSMVGVALPSIGKDLHLAAGSLQWIVSGYVLGYGGLLLLGGPPTCWDVVPSSSAPSPSSGWPRWPAPWSVMPAP